MKKLLEYYSNFVNAKKITQNFTKLIPAEHSMVTDDYGNVCSVFASPYINNCNYSAAYNILQHIYSDIRPANKSVANASNLQEFDQSEFFFGVPKAVSMDSTGFIYVPTACQDMKKVCRLHIVFHGCLQGRGFLSTVFVENAGYNALAEANDIIILYPQIVTSTLNPAGCWDWWGYSSPAYVCKLGPQMAGVKLMLDKIVF